MNDYGAMRVPFIFIVDFEMNKPVVFRTDEISGNNIRFAIGEKEVKPIQKKIYFKTYPVEFEKYDDAFNYVVHQISLGNSYLTNLTFPTRIETNLSLEEIYTHSLC